MTSIEIEVNDEEVFGQLVIIKKAVSRKQGSKFAENYRFGSVLVRQIFKNSGSVRFAKIFKKVVRFGSVRLGSWYCT